MTCVIPEKVECEVLYAGRAVEGLMLFVRLGMVRKNAYTLTIGPTDDKGRAVLLRPELERQVEAELSMGLMDYLPLATGFGGNVLLSVMTKEQVDAALKVYGEFKKCVAFPSDYRVNMQHAREVLEALAPVGPFVLQASAVPDSIRVRVPGRLRGML